MILLLGMGKSNQSISRFLDKNFIEYVYYDDKEKNIVDLDNIDLIIKSNGIARHNLLEKAKEKKLKIISDLEYYYYYKSNSILITVTGTNGKTTTVSLAKNIIKDIDLVGNIGQAFFDFINDNDAIIEASSYMLDYTEIFHSKISCFLNIFPNHLDHHGNFINYIKAKLKMLKNYKIDDYLIFNNDDILLKRIFSSYQMNKIPFSITSKTTCYYYNNKIIFNDDVYSLDEFNLLGKHNIYNALASVAIAKCYNIHHDKIQDGLNSFRGVEHRIEYCGTVFNAKVYNDSKATNLLALQSSLNCFIGKNICLVCGGKNDYISDICKLVTSNITVYAFGSNKNLIAQAVQNAIVYDTLNEVVDNINYSKYDVILFSPASQSFDQYHDYEERGYHFKQLIKKYINKF